jgi:Winged helix DNA-binding domain
VEDDRVRRTRASANLLHRPVTTKGPAGAAEVVRRACGLQAQTWAGAVLQVRARSTRTTKADVDTAREVGRSVVRGWFQRGTLHLVAAEDFGWLLSLLGPVLDHRGERRYRQLGLDERTRERATTFLTRELEHGPLTRAEIRAALLREGLVDDSEPQAVIHLLYHLGLAGLICYGPDRGRDPTWVLTADWLDRPDARPDPDQAPAELAGRYLAAYGPATPKDLAAWSGLPVTTARKAFAARDDLVDVEVHGETAAALASQRPVDAAGPVRLLGEFDTYLLGHADRTPILDEEYRRQVNAGGGLIKPVVVDDGRVVGTWRFDRREGVTEVEPFGDPPDLGSEPADVRRFYDLAAI